MCLQTPGFLDPKYPQKVYKVVKALYGLHQAPRAWYATLSTFLLKNGYRRGTIDKTLFIKKDKHDIILVQVYVDDIIFGSTKKSWCDEFEALMKSQFQMSSMGELTFFLGLQLHQLETQKLLVKDEEASDVDVHLYRFQIVTMLEKILTGNPQQEAVNFLAVDSFLGNAKSKPLWLLLLQKQNMLLLASVVGRISISFKTKHIAIRHHFIRDAYEKKLIQVLKIHTDDNVADLLTKAFDVSRKKLLTIGDAFPEYRQCRISTAGQSLYRYRDVEEKYRQGNNLVGIWRCMKGNAEFHEIIDFLKRSSIHHALLFTVSPVVSTTFVEQFWTSAKSTIINNVRHITAKVAGKSVSISEASIRSDLLFDDADGIDTLPNKPIFDAIQAYGGALSVYPPEAPTNTSTLKTSEVPNEPQTDSSPVQTSEVSDQAKEILHLKAQIKKLKKQATPVIKHHRTWLQSVSLKQRLARKKSSKKQRVHKEFVSKQGRKLAKGESSVQRIIYLITDKDKVSIDKEKVSTDRPIVSTDGSKVSTDRQIEGTDEQRKDTKDHTEEGSVTQATQTPTSTIFGDDETIAKVLLNMSQAKAVSREKEKGVELKDIEETDIPRPTSTRSLLTLKPLPKIDPKDKGKKKIEAEG
ncbi:putative ribonuclease H-like domain-containing protein [Tanacetum coccineum]